jgi:hypothetical protein
MIPASSSSPPHAPALRLPPFVQLGEGLIENLYNSHSTSLQPAILPIWVCAAHTNLAPAYTTIPPSCTHSTRLYLLLDILDTVPALFAAVDLPCAPPPRAFPAPPASSCSAPPSAAYITWHHSIGFWTPSPALFAAVDPPCAPPLRAFPARHSHRFLPLCTSLCSPYRHQLIGCRGRCCRRILSHLLPTVPTTIPHFCYQCRNQSVLALKYNTMSFLPIAIKVPKQNNDVL